MWQKYLVILNALDHLKGLKIDESIILRFFDGNGVGRCKLKYFTGGGVLWKS